MNPFRQWREARGLSCEDMATACGIDYAKVMTTELGLVRNPHPAIVQMIKFRDGEQAADELIAAYKAWYKAEQRTVTRALGFFRWRN